MQQVQTQDRSELLGMEAVHFAVLCQDTAQRHLDASPLQEGSRRAHNPNTAGMKLTSTGAQTHEVLHCCVRQQRFESPPAHVLHFQGYLFAGFASHCLLVRKQARTRVKIQTQKIRFPSWHTCTGRNNVNRNGSTTLYTRQPLSIRGGRRCCTRSTSPDSSNTVC